MQHTVEYTVDDGTTYRVQYDNETGDGEQMHYLVWENDVLKLEVNHHRLPEGLTEEMFKSTVVIGSFWNCFSRALQEHKQKALMAEEGGAYARLANLVTPHMTLRPEHISWADTLMDRGHDVELLIKVVEDAQVERFAQQLDTEVVDGEYVAAEPVLISKPDRFLSWLYPVGWAVIVVVSVAVAIFASELFGV